MWVALEKIPIKKHHFFKNTATKKPKISSFRDIKRIMFYSIFQFVNNSEKKKNPIKCQNFHSGVQQLIVSAKTMENSSSIKNRHLEEGEKFCTRPRIL